MQANRDFSPTATTAAKTSSNLQAGGNGEALLSATPRTAEATEVQVNHLMQATEPVEDCLAGERARELSRARKQMLQWIS